MDSEQLTILDPVDQARVDYEAALAAERRAVARLTRAESVLREVRMECARTKSAWVQAQMNRTRNRNPL